MIDHARESRPGRAAWTAAAAAAAVLFVSGCQSGGQAQNPADDRAPAASSSNPSTSSSGPTRVSIAPANGSAVAPDTKVTVRASGGPISSVSVTDSKNRAVLGKLSADMMGWTASRYLRPSTRYTVVVAAASGKTSNASFTTTSAAIIATYQVLPATGAVVGVGMPLIIQFDSPVSDAGKAEVEQNLAVTTSPAVTGSWGWLDDRQVMYRPVRYWAAGTKVRLRAALAGVKTGPGKYVGADASTSYTIGRSMVSYVNIKTHQMTVYQNGVLLKTLPVSTGRPGPTTETRSGVKVVISKEPTHIFDSTTIGIPKGTLGYYRLTGQWAMRLTWSGEFLHSAPWSVGAQGNANVSHGCTNLSPANALWLYNRTKVGDVVKYIGSNRSMEPGNGYTIWNYPIADWQTKSALRRG